MKVSELQISIIICVWLPMLDPSNYVNGEVEVGFLFLAVIISDKRYKKTSQQVEFFHSLIISFQKNK